MAVIADVGFADAAAETRLAGAWREFAESRTAVIALVVVVLLIGVALFAPLIVPQNPYDLTQLSIMDNKLPPLSRGLDGMLYLLGTDDQGRDMLSAILYGLRLSLYVSVVATAIALALGTVAGIVAAYFGGRIDALLMRLVDIQLSFPAILIALLVFGVARGLIAPQNHEQAAIIVLIIAIGLSNWASYARTVRGSTLVEKNKDYVMSARVMGRSAFAIMSRHVLPNVTGPVLVIATINLALAIIAESTLSFLGVGVPPTQPSLGTLIRVGQQFLFSGEWWILFYPALDLVLLALSINLLGDWLRDALNPKLR